MAFAARGEEGIEIGFGRDGRILGSGLRASLSSRVVGGEHRRRSGIVQRAAVAHGRIAYAHHLDRVIVVHRLVRGDVRAQDVALHRVAVARRW